MELPKNDNSNEIKSNPVYGKVMLSLDNCLLPQEKLENSPSIVDGLDCETEYDLRIIGCELIQTAGILLKLPQVAMATGQVLFQRFYFCKSFVRHPMDVTAMGCVCLASKIEEAPRRIRDVINVFHHIRQVRCQKPITPLILDQQYSALKTQIIKAERRILKELGFCVHVKHPHKLIVCYLQVLALEKNAAVMQMAWNYMNDSLRTNVFLQYAPETVACACIYLTVRKLKVILAKTPAWYSLFNVKEEEILDICRKIVQLYRRPKIDPDVLESKVDRLRKNYDEKREKLRSNITASGNNSPNTNNLNVNSNNVNNGPSPQPKIDPVISPPKNLNSVKRSQSGLKSESPKKKVKSESPKNKKSESPKIKKSKKYRKSSQSTSRSRSPTPERHKHKKSSYKSKRNNYPSSPVSSPYEYSKKYKSKRIRDYKIVNSDSDDDYVSRSRSNNGNYWKKYYSYA